MRPILFAPGGLFRGPGGVVLALNVGEVHGRLRQLHVHVLETLCDDLRDRQVAKPFVVRRDYKPGRVIRAGPAQHLLEGGDVVVPVRALLVVGFADLPLPGRIIQPLLKTGQLLFLGDVEEKLENRRFVLDGQQPVKVVSAGWVSPRSR